MGNGDTHHRWNPWNNPTVLGLSDLAQLSKFLQPEQNFLNYL